MSMLAATLERHLLERWIRVVSSGDVWVMQFDDDRFLVAQAIGGPLVDRLGLTLAREHASDLALAIETDDVACAAALALVQRARIDSVELRPDGTLRLGFPVGLLECSVGSPYVDWQWMLSSRSLDPYRHPFAVACMEPGAVVLGTEA